MASSIFKDYFSNQAQNYAKYRPHYPPELFEYLAHLVPQPHAAWDCATGNGQVALGLASYFQTVYATDASAAQIAHAFPHERIHYAVAPAETSGLTDRSVDLVTVGLALHWFDLERFYQEVNRVVKPAGAIAVWCTGRFQLPQAPDPVNQTLEKLHELLEPLWHPEIQLVVDRYQTIPFPFVECVSPEFTRVEWWTVTDLIGCITTWSSVQQLVQQQGDAVITELFDELETAWGDAAVAQPICWQIYLRSGYVNG